MDGKKYQLLGYDAKGSPVYEDAQIVQARKKRAEKPAVLDNDSSNDIMKSFEIGKSLGASAKNYPVKLPDSRQHTKFAEGQEIKGVTFAGKGTSKEIRDRFRLESKYKIPASEWQKVSGNAVIVMDGKNQNAEIHWYEARGVKVEMKVKRLL